MGHRESAPAATLGGVEAGHRTEQPDGVRHDPAAGQVGNGCRLDGPARVHHQRAVGELRHHAEVVGDDQHACARHVAGGAQHVEYLGLDGDVERRRRLVADDEVRVVGDRNRDHHALAFAAGQLVGEGLGSAFGLRYPHQFEQLDGPCRGGCAANAVLVHAKCFGDLLADGVDGGQRRHRVLEDGADDPASNA